MLLLNSILFLITEFIFLVLYLSSHIPIYFLILQVVLVLFHVFYILFSTTQEFYDAEPTLTFKQFLRLYSENPDIWVLFSDHIRISNSTKYYFKYVHDIWLYKFWHYQKKRQDLKKRNTDEFQRSLN